MAKKKPAPQPVGRHASTPPSPRAESDSAGTSRRLATVDLGSNSIRLLVAEVLPDGGYTILDDEKQTTRLAKGIDRTGVLSEEAMAMSLEALAKMKTIADGFRADRLEIIATSAVREARNQRQFLSLVRERLGLDINIIPADEEGQLSFLSVARHFDLKPIDAIIVDLGGGSAELIFSARGILEDIYSLPLGAVRLTESLIRTDPLAESDYRRLKRRIRKCFQKLVGKPDFVPHVMIGAGGTFLALAQMSMRRRGQVYSTFGGYELNRSEVRHIFDHLKDLPLRARRNVPGLHADRADIILAGLVVIEQLMKLLQVNRLQIHDKGIRDGLLLRMVAQTFPRKPAAPEEETDPLTGVRNFAAACAYEPKHAHHVAHIACQLFDQLQEPLNLPASERLLLEAAGLLHEVGYLINYKKHHQHSYHLIVHGNLRGLTPKQRELVANIARYHRRAGPKLKHENFARLLPDERDTVRRLSALLRLADGLDRTHTQQIKEVHCQRKEGQLLLTVVAEQKPEVDLWGAQRKGKLFRKVFGLKCKFLWMPAGNQGNRETR